MDTERMLVEVFSAGCPACTEAVKLVAELGRLRCDVRVLDMHLPDVAERAEALGVRSVPAIAVDGILADCCQGRGLSEEALTALGLG